MTVFDGSAGSEFIIKQVALLYEGVVGITRDAFYCGCFRDGLISKRFIYFNSDKGEAL
jgi:hypothetical protein